jgi:hypothetical protein
LHKLGAPQRAVLKATEWTLRTNGPARSNRSGSRPAALFIEAWENAARVIGRAHRE